MSGKAVAWVLRHRPAHKGQADVLIAVADGADAKGEHSHHSVATIAHLAGKSEGHCRAVLATLVRDKWLEVTENGHGGRGLATEYCLVGMKPSDSEEQNPQITSEKPSDCERETLRFRRSALFSTTEKPTEKPTCDLDIVLDRLWAVFPHRRGDAKVPARMALIPAVRKADPEIIISAAAAVALVTKDKRFSPSLARWLDEERWNDDPGEPDDEDRWFKDGSWHRKDEFGNTVPA